MRMPNLNEFLDTMKLGGMRTGHLMKDKAPEIIFVLSTVAVIKGVIESRKEAPEWEKEYKKHLERVNYISEQHEVGTYTDAQETKEMVKEGWTLTKSFLRKNMKSIIYTGLGLTGFGVSFKLVRDSEKKWKTYACEGFLTMMAYRGRVADVVGKDKEYDIFHNIKRELVEEEYIDENGKKKKRQVERIVNPGGQVAGDDNSVWFGAGDTHYTGVKEFDLNWVIDTEMMFNRILVGRGHGGKVTREEIERYGKSWYENDRYKFNAHEMGWIYDANRDDYEYYLDPITGKKTGLPRIIQFTCSREFMDKDDDTDETYIEFNCYPLSPILKQMQENLLDEVRRARGGKYIPMYDPESMAFKLA